MATRTLRRGGRIDSAPGLHQRSNNRPASIARMAAEHRGTSFAHSCVKVPVDPYSRQPTPLYERPRATPQPAPHKHVRPTPCRRQEERSAKACDVSRTMDNRLSTELECASEDFDSILDFYGSIPDYVEVHHLSNEQFKQKLDYLKRKQRLLLKNLRNCLEQDENVDPSRQPAAPRTKTPMPATPAKSAEGTARQPRGKSPGEKCCDAADLQLKGKRCTLEECRTNSPLLYPPGSFSCLAEDQDFLTYRCKEREKALKERQNEEILSGRKDWRSGSETKSAESLDSDVPEISPETKSLPARSPKRWHPTLPKPFSFTLREDAERYMTMVEQQAAEELAAGRPKKHPAKKRRIRPVPLTSKIPLYDKLVAEKEARSRIVREESALNLLSQVRPFKLECDRRALRALTRSSPELSCARRLRAAGLGADPIDVAPTRFRAKPVPRNLFSTEIYDRMLEDEYFRNLQKRVRAVELMKSASLPPSMARRERCKSASERSQNTNKSSSEERARSSTGGRDSVGLNRGTPLISERSRSSFVATTLPPHGNNYASLLRAQAAREKLEREMQEQLEEKRREQLVRLRKSLLAKKPAWRALRSAARHEHERDLDFRASLRRDEAREQAERHRLQMEMMLDRVTRIPTLFERYSQSFQSSMKLLPQLHSLGSEAHPIAKTKKKKKKKKKSSKRQSSSSTDSYASLASSSRPNSGSITSSSSTPVSLGRFSGSDLSRKAAAKSAAAVVAAAEKKRSERGPLRVSINETAQLIEDDRDPCETLSIDSATSQAKQEREKRVLGTEGDVHEKE